MSISRINVVIVLLFLWIGVHNSGTPLAAPAYPPAGNWTTGGFLYALINDTAGVRLYGYQVNHITGELMLIPGFPVATNGLGNSTWAPAQLLVCDAVNGRLYALNPKSKTVSAYTIDRSSGALTELSFSPISLGDTGGAIWTTWLCVAVHPGGSPLLVGNTNYRLASYVIGASTATLTAGSPFTTGSASAFSCAFSPDGKYVYTGGDEGSTIAGFGVDAATGALTSLAGSPYQSGAIFPVAYAADAAGRLFISNLQANQVRVFTTTGGVPSQATGSPFVSGLSEGVHGVLHASGYYMVADRVGNRVGVYRIAGSGASTSLAAVSGSPFSAGGTNTNILAQNQSGTYLFAANAGSRNISTFAVNAVSGALTQLSVQAANTMGASGVIGGLAYQPIPFPLYLPLVVHGPNTP